MSVTPGDREPTYCKPDSTLSLQCNYLNMFNATDMFNLSEHRDLSLSLYCLKIFHNAHL